MIKEEQYEKDILHGKEKVEKIFSNNPICCVEPKNSQEKKNYQIKWPRVSFLIWCDDMYTLTQPIIVTACNAGIRSAIDNHSIWEKVIAVQMLSESIQISLFTFFFQKLFPFG